MSRVAVIGAGYVGLTVAAGMAHLGHEVTCADVDALKLARLAKGEVPILEEGLPELVAQGLAQRRLSFVLGAAAAAAGREFAFLCVPTPQRADGAADLSFVEAAVRQLAPVLPSGAVVVNKSTVPVGSTDVVRRALAEAGAARDVSVVSNPEFLREGSAIADFLRPDRIVIGSDDPAAATRVADLYARFDAPVVVTDPASAEMIKYASNAFLATKISFINAIAAVCESVGADVTEVAAGMGLDPRIGPHFLRPGPGYGGSCFPKDTAALLHTAAEAGYRFGLLSEVVEVNRRQRELIVDKLRRATGSLPGARVAVWGLAFKAGTDDLRESPAMAIVERLLREGAHVTAYDPGAGEHAAGTLPGLHVVADAYEACEGADVLTVLTEWDEFRTADFMWVRQVMARPAVVDGRNLLEPETMEALGFAYEGVGQPRPYRGDGPRAALRFSRGPVAPTGLAPREEAEASA